MQNEIIELRKKGMGYREIAEAMNCTKATVVYYCRKSNLGGVRGNGALSGNQYFTSYEDAEVMFRNNFNKVYEGRFEYVSDYNGCEQKFKMKCCVCRSEQMRSANVVRHKKNIECSNCILIKRDNILAEKEKKRLINVIRKQLSSISKQNERKLSKVIVCAECGKEFTPSNTGYVCCSEECRRRRANRRNELNRRHKLKENGKIDWSISLDRVITNDDNVCYLCGGKCDKNDYTISNNGHFIAGETYPSIDHVIPVAKGGTHTWDNVRLAHFRCNSNKRDTSGLKMNRNRVQMDI